MALPVRQAFSRLPKDVIPSNYAIRLKPYVSDFTFDGHEEITVQVVKETKYIILNCLHITLSSVSYKGQNDSQEFSADIQVAYSVEDETVTFTFPADLKVGAGTLSITYTGELNDKMKGFYRSKYLTSEGEQRHGAVTQFEPTYARFAFPCWDEPAVKATFDVTLVVPKDRVALSNMPVESEASLETDSAWKVLKFSRTPVMSTYLLAFVIGEFDFVEARDSDGVLVRVYTPKGKSVQGKFALEVAVKTLPFYHKYFNIAYPLPKMDLIAIADFAAGAMENWGLVTYRETTLLVDPDNTSASSKQFVAIVVGHEIAHQWFGNLVTMEWWTHLWLNEGFASWIEFLCVDHCFPEYDIWTQFATTDYSRALQLDALRNSHAIEVEVGHPSEVDEIFDAISYQKGASVIRMLHDYIGDDDFRKGMHAYLTKHAYKNTFTEDLWEALGAASGKPIADIMSTWTKQMGFPVIKVEHGVSAGDTPSLTVSQQKFTADGSSDSAGSQWMVPLSVSTSLSPDKPVHRCLLNSQQMNIVLAGVKTDGWIKINTGGVGFYRTLYPTDMLQALLPGISQQTLPPRDRLSLVNDLFALSRAGVVSSSVDVLKVVAAFISETNYTVWSDISSSLTALAYLYQTTDFWDHFTAFIRRLFATIKGVVGFDAQPGEGHLTAMLRSLVIGQLGKYGDQSVISEAKSRFVKHCDGSAMLSADMRNAVYSIVAKHGTAEDYEQLLQLYRKTDLQEEKVRILTSLGASSDQALIQRTLVFSIGDEVRSMDSVFGIASVTGSVQGRDLAWAFIKQHWALLHGRYSSGFLLARLVKSTTENFCTEERASEIQAFFQANPAPGAERTIQQCLENISLNASQLSRDREPVSGYLTAFK